MKLSTLVESAGRLVKVIGYCFSELPNELAAIELQFKNLNCSLRVIEETDEIQLSPSCDFTGLVNHGLEPILSKYCGYELLWVWEMKNNQGYTDGLKFEFKGHDVAIELIVVASSIKQFCVTQS
jgi:hypothetical protein